MYNELDYKTERTILSMKKVIAVILSILCVLTCFAPAVCAIEDPGLIGMLEPEGPTSFESALVKPIIAAFEAL